MPFNHQIKIRQIFICVHVRMAILYHTARFKSANNIVWGKTAKFNDRQYFQLSVTVSLLDRIIYYNYMYQYTAHHSYLKLWSYLKTLMKLT